jgi:hypothetical protein
MCAVCGDKNAAAWRSARESARSGWTTVDAVASARPQDGNPLASRNLRLFHGSFYNPFPGLSVNASPCQALHKISVRCPAGRADTPGAWARASPAGAGLAAARRAPGAAGGGVLRSVYGKGIPVRRRKSGPTGPRRADGDRLVAMAAQLHALASGDPDDSTPTGESNAFEVNYVKAWQFR